MIIFYVHLLTGWFDRKLCGHNVIKIRFTSGLSLCVLTASMLRKTDSTLQPEREKRNTVKENMETDEDV